MQTVESLERLVEILESEVLTVTIDVKLADGIKNCPMTIDQKSVLDFIGQIGWYAIPDNSNDHGRIRVGYDGEKKTLKLHW